MFSSKYKNNRLFDFLTRSKFRVWRRILFILAFIPIALSMAFFVFGNNPEIPISTIYGFGIGLTIVAITFAYLNNSYLAPHYLPKGEYATYTIALLLSGAGFVFLKYIAENQILSSVGIFRQITGITVVDWLSNLTLYSICIASSSISILFNQWMADNARIESLEYKHLKNSIDEIKNRINPQFLYATLDYVSEKVKYDPEQTSETLFNLSELLSYQLYDCRRNSILLESDIEFIRTYLILEQQNSGNRFTFTISVTGKVNQFIPPNLFMPLIEEIMKQQPVKLSIIFNTDNCLIRFECIVPDTDLSLCDFKKSEQRLLLLYGNNIFIGKKNESIKLQFKIC